MFEMMRNGVPCFGAGAGMQGTGTVVEQAAVADSVFSHPVLAWPTSAHRAIPPAPSPPAGCGRWGVESTRDSNSILSMRGLPASASAHRSTLESAYLVAAPDPFVLHCACRRTRTVWSQLQRSVHGRAALGGYRRHPKLDAGATRWRALTTRPAGTAAEHERRIGQALLGSALAQSDRQAGCWTRTNRSRWQTRYEALRGSVCQASHGTNPVVFGCGLRTKGWFGNSRETVYRRPGGKRR